MCPTPFPLIRLAPIVLLAASVDLVLTPTLMRKAKRTGADQIHLQMLLMIPSVPSLYLVEVGVLNYLVLQQVLGIGHGSLSNHLNIHY